MKLATAYLRKNRIYLYASSQATEELWMLSGLVAVISSAEDSRINREVDNILEHSRQNIPHPKEWGNIFEPVLQAAGVKSWSVFAKIAKCISIEIDGTICRYIPSTNLGPSEGFEPKNDEAIEVIDYQKTDVLKSLLDAFDKCD